MTEQLNFSIKEIVNESENFTVRIHNLLKYRKLSLVEINAQIMIIKGLVETARHLDDVQNDDGKVTIRLFVEQKSVTAEVSKRVSLSSYRKLGQLDKLIQRIRGYQSPFDPYIAALRDVSPESKKDQLIAQRLAKLAYETGAVFDFFVTEENILNLSALRYLHAKCVR